jgi:hypothetical protein
MSLAGLHLLAAAVPTLAAGALMTRAGTQKKLLEWKSAPRLCPVCGRTDRHRCPAGG